MKKTSFYTIIICQIAAFFFAGSPLLAQDIRVDQDQLSAKQLIAKGDSLRMAYSFGAALRAYEDAARQAQDSLERLGAEEAAMLAKNGLNMLDFCNHPIVVAREKFSKEDFFLYYPLPDQSWRPLPNALDSIVTAAPVNVTYIPDGADRIFYSAADNDRIRNIYTTSWGDSLWTAPELLGESHTSSGNEIFPMLSPDGQSLYFASDGLYGMGGYDLYVSVWNKDQGEWDVPTNLGFPYSSPADDYLFVNTADGKYSIFASNRECSSDSVYVYVLEYDSTPVRSNVDDGSDEIRSLAALAPSTPESIADNTGPISGDEAYGEDQQMQRRYVASVLEVKSLRDSIGASERRLEHMREQLAGSEESSRQVLSNLILSIEQDKRALEDSLTAATGELNKLEMDIILSGRAIDPDKVLAMVDRDVNGAAPGYAFSAHHLGPVPDMRVAIPEVKFDYSFMILPEGRFAEDNKLPGGLVYQIQLFQSSKMVGTDRLKGLSPVFWKKAPSGRYTYYAGLFRTYKDVLSNLNKAKKAGFKSALIVAFKDGNNISVAAAKKMETTDQQSFCIRVKVGGNGALTDEGKAVLTSVTGKELARNVAEDGSVSYVIGTWKDRSEAEAFLQIVRSNGFPEALLEQVR